MQETTLGIPYFELGDVPDLPLITKGIADASSLLVGQDRARVDQLTTQTGGDPSTSLIDPLVGLPVAPSDGQVCYVVASAVARWAVQYDQANDRWIFVGGLPLIATIDPIGSKTNTGDNGYTVLGSGDTTDGPTLTPPLPGTYRYRISCYIGAADPGQEAAAGLKIGGAAVNDDSAAVNYNTRLAAVTTGLRSTGHVTNADVLIVRYRNNGAVAGAQFSHRTLELIPQTLDPA